ncbi:uncharacterized protein LOC111394928 [Olea europaea var. sylvestris]|uniref:uncharacterized protein LOC111394928 n=1 Tax=Olea europaea var. sylvestris TaxID=158386 RepID=UPI000C1D88B0|nr:uncharacterized protein LOC111394928 [Olea europaea var. sylvestris]
MFLKHVPFFSISGNTHNVTRTGLINIDPFSDDINNLPSHTPCTIDSSCPASTHASDHATPLPSMASQSPPEIIDPTPASSLPRYPQRIPPTTVHGVAVVRILRYLGGTCFQILLFPSALSLVLHAYSDTDWASDPIDCKSTTGFCIFLDDSLISWKSKK